MARDFAEANVAQRGLRRFAASGPGSWLFARYGRPKYGDPAGFHPARVGEEAGAFILEPHPGVSPLVEGSALG